MKKPRIDILLVMLSSLLAGACNQTMFVKDQADKLLAAGIKVYCKAQEPVRLVNRERIANLIKPNRIEIQCNPL